jgi:uncharacterized membrane protein YczE
MVSELYDMMLWVAYGIAGLIMLTTIVAAVLAGLGLRFVAESLRGLGDRDEGDARNGSEGQTSYGDRRFR